jgi:Fe-S cluster assembly iron-binding protein IscA
MFEVSDEALEKIKQFLEGIERPRAIRILATEREWKIPALVLALDEKTENDEVFNKEGVTFLIGKKLFEKAKPICIGYNHSILGSGYTLKSAFSDELEDANVGCHAIHNSCRDV